MPLPQDAAATASPTCWGCRFWEYLTEHMGVVTGECRRRAPTPDAGSSYVRNHGVWPITRDKSWCGEFGPRIAEGAS